MGEKSTIIRDKYAIELQVYIDETSASEWPVYRKNISRSGLERIMKARGLKSFERKRLESAACRPLVKKMNLELSHWLLEQSEPEKVEIQNQSGKTELSYNLNIDSKELAKAQRLIAQLEKSLKKAEKQAERYREKCALLQTEIDASERQQDAFEKHCRDSMRTLHFE